MVQDEFALTLKTMGANDEEIAQALAVQFPENADKQGGHPDVQPANVLIVHLFFYVAKYWERAGMEATPLCLDPLKVEARASKLAWYKKLDDVAMELLWHGLDIMENACLVAWSKKSESK